MVGGVYSVHDYAARDACGLLRSIVCCCWSIVPNESPVDDVLYRTKDYKYIVFIIFDRTELGFNAHSAMTVISGRCTEQTTIGHGGPDLIVLC